MARISCASCYLKGFNVSIKSTFFAFVFLRNKAQFLLNNSFKVKMWFMFKIGWTRMNWRNWRILTVKLNLQWGIWQPLSLWNVGHLNFVFWLRGGGFDHCKIQKVKCSGIYPGNVTPSFWSAHNQSISSFRFGHVVFWKF
jgi:hypothetical protein